MNKQKVYIESSVISYFTSKPSKSLIVAGHQKVTYDGGINLKANLIVMYHNLLLMKLAKGIKLRQLRD